MCAVSMVYDWAEHQNPRYWNYQNYDALKELIRRAEEYDKRTNQPHCEDAEKAKVLERIEKRLAEIEKKLDQR